jgi:hypothetical protein
MKRNLLILLCSLFVLFLLVSPVMGQGTVETIYIDFEGLAPGTIVSTLTPGYGISGGEGVIPGYVEVFGHLPSRPGVNSAMIFDATCGGGTPDDCSGGDPDLFKPQLGNVLILSEDMDSTDPDDADEPDSFFNFDFRNLGAGVVSIDYLYVLDVEDEEGGAHGQFYSGGPDGTLLATVQIPNVGNNGLATVAVNLSGIDYARITLNGSGAIDGFQIQVQPGVTPTPPTATPVTPTNTPTQTQPPGVTLTPPTATSVTPTNTPTPTSTFPVPPAITFTSTPEPTEPNAVTLVDFSVTGVSENKVSLSWKTASEVDHYEFKLYRSNSSVSSGAELVATFPGTPDGAHGKTYAHTDSVPDSGRWYYWLVDVDTSGKRTWHGPVTANVTTVGSSAQLDKQIFVPFVQIGN